MASRGDAATFDPYAVDPARQLRQRKVFRIYAAPNARRPKRRATSGAKGLGRRTIGRGWPLPRSKDNAKSFWHQMGYLRAVLLCAKSRTAPWCAKVTSSHRRSLHAARPIHERSENGPLRRESAAETTSWVPEPRNAFLQKLCIWAKWRRRST